MRETLDVSLWSVYIPTHTHKISNHISRYHTSIIIATQKTDVSEGSKEPRSSSQPQENSKKLSLSFHSLPPPKQERKRRKRKKKKQPNSSTCQNPN